MANQLSIGKRTLWATLRSMGFRYTSPTVSRDFSSFLEEPQVKVSRWLREFEDEGRLVRVIGTSRDCPGGRRVVQILPALLG